MRVPCNHYTLTQYYGGCPGSVLSFDLSNNITLPPNVSSFSNIPRAITVPAYVPVGFLAYTITPKRFLFQSYQ
jgi:hypothetical protein